MTILRNLTHHFKSLNDRSSRKRVSLGTKIIGLSLISLSVVLMLANCGGAPAGGNPVPPVDIEQPNPSNTSPPIESAAIEVRLGLDANADNVEIASYEFDSNNNIGTFTLGTFTNVASSQPLVLSFTIPAGYGFVPPESNEYIIDESNPLLARATVMALRDNVNEQGFLDLATFRVRAVDASGVVFSDVIYSYVVRAKYVMPSESVIPQSFSVMLAGSSPSVDSIEAVPGAANTYHVQVTGLTNRANEDTIIAFTPPTGYTLTAPSESSPYTHTDSDNEGTVEIASADLVTFTIQAEADSSQSSNYIVRGAYAAQATPPTAIPVADLTVNYAGSSSGDASSGITIALSDTEPTYTVSGLTNLDNPDRSIMIAALSDPMFAYALADGVTVDEAGVLTLSASAFAVPAGRGPQGESELAMFRVQETAYTNNGVTYTIKADSFADGRSLPVVTATDFKVTLAGSNPRVEAVENETNIFQITDLTNRADEDTMIEFVNLPSGYRLVGSIPQTYTYTNSDRAGTGAIDSADLVTFMIESQMIPNETFTYTLRGAYAAQASPPTIPRTALTVNYAGSSSGDASSGITVALSGTTYTVSGLTNGADPDRSMMIAALSGPGFVYDDATNGITSNSDGTLTIEKSAFTIPAGEGPVASESDLATFRVYESAYTGNDVTYTIKADRFADGLPPPSVTTNNFQVTLAGSTPNVDSVAAVTGQVNAYQVQVTGLTNRANENTVITFTPPTDYRLTTASESSPYTRADSDGASTGAIASDDLVTFTIEDTNNNLRVFTYTLRGEYVAQASPPAISSSTITVVYGGLNSENPSSGITVALSGTTYTVSGLTNRDDLNRHIVIGAPSDNKFAYDPSVGGGSLVTGGDLRITAPGFTEPAGSGPHGEFDLATFRIHETAYANNGVTYTIKADSFADGLSPPSVTAGNFQVTLAGSTPSVVAVTSDPNVFQVEGLTNRANENTVITFTLPTDYQLTTASERSPYTNTDSDGASTGAIASNDLVTFTIEDTNNNLRVFTYTLRGEYLAQASLPSIPAAALTVNYAGTNSGVSGSGITVALSDTTYTVSGLTNGIDPDRSMTIAALGGPGFVYDASAAGITSNSDGTLTIGKSAFTIPTGSGPVTSESVLATFRVYESAYTGNDDTYTIRADRFAARSAPAVTANNFQVTLAGSTPNVAVALALGETSKYQVDLTGLTNRVDEDTTVRFTLPDGYQFTAGSTRSPHIVPSSTTNRSGTSAITSRDLVTFEIADVNDANWKFTYTVNGAYAAQASPPTIPQTALTVNYDGTNSGVSGSGITVALSGTTYTVSGLTNGIDPTRSMTIAAFNAPGFVYDDAANGITSNGDGTLTIAKSAFTIPAGEGPVASESDLATFRVYESVYRGNSVTYTIRADRFADGLSSPIVTATDFQVTLVGSTPNVVAVTGEPNVFQVEGLTNRVNEDAVITFTPPTDYELVDTATSELSPYTHRNSDRAGTGAITSENLVVFTIADRRYSQRRFTYTLRGAYLAQASPPTISQSDLTVNYDGTNSGVSASGITVALSGMTYTVSGLTNGADPTRSMMIAALGGTGFVYDTSAAGFTSSGGTLTIAQSAFMLPAGSGPHGEFELATFRIQETAYANNSVTYTIRADSFADGLSPPSVTAADFQVTLVGSTPSVVAVTGEPNVFEVEGLTNRAGSEVTTINFAIPSGYELTSGDAVTDIVDADTSGTGALDSRPLVTFAIRDQTYPSRMFAYTVRGAYAAQATPAISDSDLTITYGGSNSGGSAITVALSDTTYTVSGLTNRENPLDRRITIAALRTPGFVYETSATGVTLNGDGTLMIGADAFTDPSGTTERLTGFLLATFTVYETAYRNNARRYEIQAASISAQATPPFIPVTDITVAYGGSNLGPITYETANKRYNVAGMTNRKNPDRSITILAPPQSNIFSYDTAAAPGQSVDPTTGQLTIAKAGFSDPSGEGALNFHDLAAVRVVETAYPANSVTYTIRGTSIAAQPIIDDRQVTVNFQYPDTTVQSVRLDTDIVPSINHFTLTLNQSPGDPYYNIPYRPNGNIILTAGGYDSTKFQLISASPNTVLGSSVTMPVTGVNGNYTNSFQLQEIAYPGNSYNFSLQSVSISKNLPRITASYSYAPTSGGTLTGAFISRPDPTDLTADNIILDLGGSNIPFAGGGALTVTLEGYDSTLYELLPEVDSTHATTGATPVAALPDPIATTTTAGTFEYHFVLREKADTNNNRLYIIIIDFDVIPRAPLLNREDFVVTLTGSEPTVNYHSSDSTIFEVSGLTNRPNEATTIAFTNIPNGYRLIGTSPREIPDSDDAGTGALASRDLVTFEIESIIDSSVTFSYTLRGGYAAQPAFPNAPTGSAVVLNYGGSNSRGSVVSIMHSGTTYTVTGLTNRDDPERSIVVPPVYSRHFMYDTTSDGIAVATDGSLMITPPAFFDPAGTDAVTGEVTLATYSVYEIAYPGNRIEYTIKASGFAAETTPLPPITAANFRVTLEGSPSATVTATTGDYKTFTVTGLTNRANKDTVIELINLPAGYQVTSSASHTNSDSDGPGTGARGTSDLATFVIMEDPSSGSFTFFTYVLRGAYSAQATPPFISTADITVNYGGSNLGPITYDVANKRYNVAGMTNRRDPDRSITFPALAQVGGVDVFSYDTTAIGQSIDTTGLLTVAKAGFSDPAGESVFLSFHTFAMVKVVETAYPANSVTYAIRGTNIAAQPLISVSSINFKYPDNSAMGVDLQTNDILPSLSYISLPEQSVGDPYHDLTYQTNGNIILTVGYDANMFQLVTSTGVVVAGSTVTIPVAQPGDFTGGLSLREIGYPANNRNYQFNNLNFPRNFPTITASYTYTPTGGTAITGDFQSYVFADGSRADLQVNEFISFGPGGTLSFSLSGYDSNLYQLVHETNANHDIGTAPVMTLPVQTIAADRYNAFDYHFELQEIANPNNKRLHVIKLTFMLVDIGDFEVTQSGSSVSVNRVGGNSGDIDFYLSTFGVTGLTNGDGRDVSVTFTPPVGYGIVNEGTGAVGGAGVPETKTVSDPAGTDVVAIADLTTFKIRNLTDSTKEYTYTVRGSFAAGSIP
ncbi:hypothetical protein COTS27_00220 [Spirochaetota bacterium]|nr:hypothetical protein COTS27_00220 [Spirochaetota bacterium]